MKSFLVIEITPDDIGLGQFMELREAAGPLPEYEKILYADFTKNKFEIRFEVPGVIKLVTDFHGLNDSSHWGSKQPSKDLGKLKK